MVADPSAPVVAPVRVPAAPPASSEATHHVMQANKSKNTKPELMVRRALRAAGLTGYRIHWKKVPGHPDICFVGRRIAIFVHGCYWHRCPYCALPRPRSHPEFWEAKFARNRERDARDVAELTAAGWTVVVVWECRLKKRRAEATLAEVIDVVRGCGTERREGRVVEAGSLGARRLAAIRVRRRSRRA